MADISYGMGVVTATKWNEPQAKAIRDTPTVTDALRDLSEAARILAERTEEFINARLDLTEARDRYNTCRDIVAKEQESANV